MSTQLKIKRLLLTLLGVLFLGSLAGAAPSDAGYRYGYSGYDDDDDDILYERVVRRPVVRRVVIVERPVVYRPRPIVRTVVVERPYYPRVRYSYGWRERVVYQSGRPYGRWHDRPRCWLPERHLCD